MKQFHKVVQLSVERRHGASVSRKEGIICVDAVDAVGHGCCRERLRILTCEAFFGRIGTRG